MPVQNHAHQGGNAFGAAVRRPWRLWQLIAATAMVFALIGLGVLVWLISTSLSEGRSSTGLIWIPMVFLPLAFALLIATLLGAAIRRRRL